MPISMMDIDSLCTVVYSYYSGVTVRASITLFVVDSVGTAFLLASMTCNRNCLSSSLWVKRLKLLKKFNTPFCCVIVNNSELLNSMFALLHGTIRNHSTGQGNGKKRVVYLQLVEQSQCSSCPRRIPYFRMAGLPRTFRSVATLFKPATSVS